MSFLPEHYEIPKGQSNYFKFEQGDNVFRILSNPIVGWEGWKVDEDGNRKPVRFSMYNKPIDLRQFDKQQVKHFWAMPVWDYKSEKVKILQITQVGIQSAIENLSKDADWGEPTGYDIKVTKRGEKLETEYEVSPKPHKEVPTKAQDEFLKAKINLKALFHGDDPFNNDKVYPAEVEAPKGNYTTPEQEGISPDDIPF